MGRNATLLRGALLVDAVVFLTAALLNMGVWVPLGFAELRFAVPVWQAGIGEAIIGITLLVAGLTGWARLSWVAFWMSIVGIVFGLSSPRVQGAARDIHIVLVPLAIVVLMLQQLARLPVVPVPAGWRFQPIDADEVAAWLVELALGTPTGLASAMGGPRVYELAALVRSYLQASHRRRPILPVRTPGGAARAFQAGANRPRIGRWAAGPGRTSS
jgi:uncharacterized protein YbjT (DUF2867 family)